MSRPSAFSPFYKKWAKKATIILFVLFFAPPCQAANSFDVVINEIAWTGTETSANDEWLELYNNTDYEIDLSGWKLEAEDGSPKINLLGKIPAKGFYLLERTDDTTLLNVFADQIYTGALSNNGENLTIYDSQQSPRDNVNCAKGWFAGDKTTKKTMERKNPVLAGNDQGNWLTGKNIGGSPKKENGLAEENILIQENKAKIAAAAKEATLEKPFASLTTPLGQKQIAGAEKILKEKNILIPALPALAFAAISGSLILLLKKLAIK